MIPIEGALLFAAALAGGALNSVAGGGSFFTFPALVVSDVLPKLANATSTVALWPGTVASVRAYRKELSTHRRELVVLSGVSLVGGLLGALLLLHTSQKSFERLLPFLLLLATLVFTVGPGLTAQLRARKTSSAPITRRELRPSWRALAAMAVAQLIISIYGGFFGGGIGILMLATLGLMGMENIHEMNALKTLLASTINGVAVAAFVLAGIVVWPQALLMMGGTILGGYGGAAYARRVDPRLVRGFVIIVGFAMTLYFFLRR
jgi:uncharacterized membrane protein YfcA